MLIWWRASNLTIQERGGFDLARPAIPDTIRFMRDPTMIQELCMLRRVLSVTQARSLYLKRITDARNTSSSRERNQADRDLKSAARALQQAQMTARLRRGRIRVPRPTDWNVEIS